MDVRCVGYPAYIFAPGCARIAPGDKTALLATYVISATRFSRGLQANIVGVPLDVGES
jgi:hypothetical protein